MAKEREIEQLAALEMELIDRLRTKQQEQKKAFQQLEAVLSMGSPSKASSSSSKQLQSGGKGGAPPPKRTNGTSATSASPPPPTQEPSEEDVARAFSVYDRDGTGLILSKDVQGRA